DRGVAALVGVVGIAEGPVDQAAGHVRISGRVDDQAAQRFAVDASGRAADHAVGGTVVNAAEANHRDGGAGLDDRDGGVAGGAEVVAAGVEGPVGGAARHVGKAGAQVEEAAQIDAADARGRAGGAVGCGVVDAAVAVDRDGGRGRGDDDGRVATGAEVV